MATLDLEETLGRLEKREQSLGERKEFYQLVLMMYRSEQMSVARINELSRKYKTFGEYIRSVLIK